MINNTPDGGWKEQTYYRVTVSLYAGNCYHESIFYTGFLHNGQPSGYACFLNPTYEDGAVAYNPRKAEISFAEELFTRNVYT